MPSPHSNHNKNFSIARTMSTYTVYMNHQWILDRPRVRKDPSKSSLVCFLLASSHHKFTPLASTRPPTNKYIHNVTVKTQNRLGNNRRAGPPGHLSPRTSNPRVKHRDRGTASIQCPTSRPGTLSTPTDGENQIKEKKSLIQY